MENNLEESQVEKALDENNSDGAKDFEQIENIVVREMERFSGPIPHPRIIKGYEEACPGAADRIIKMAENQAEHRMHIEKQVVTANISNEKTGMWLSFVLSAIFMISGAGLIFIGKDAAGYGAFFGPPVFIGGSWIYTKFKDSKKDSEVQEENNESKAD